MVTRATGQSDGGLRRLVSAVFLVCSLHGGAILAPGIAKAQGEAVASFDHSAWERILEQYVDEDGLVAYERLGNQDREQLDGYLARLADAKPQQMEVNERIAFWINAYNAGIVAAILDRYSPESTLSRTRLFRWYTFRVAGEDHTPNEVEHEILRKQFAEPRIHFAVVCAATSCPKLRREAYRGEVLDQQLDDQVRRFINDPQRNRFDPTGVKLSSIFDWFEADFTAGGGSVTGFVARYAEDQQRAAALRRSGGRVEFLEYDWTLNAQEEKQESQRGSATESVDGPEKKLCEIGRRGARPAAGDPGYCTGELNG